MSAFVDIKPGQWVLAFDEPYGPFNKPLEEHVESFATRGGGWDSHRKTEILHVYQVSEVKPKTYTVGDVHASQHSFIARRQYRALVVAAGATKDEMVALRDKFFSIGVEASERTEAEMYRRIEKFAAREEAKAVKKIHRCLPHLFPKSEGQPK